MGAGRVNTARKFVVRRRRSQLAVFIAGLLGSDKAALRPGWEVVWPTSQCPAGYIIPFDTHRDALAYAARVAHNIRRS